MSLQMAHRVISLQGSASVAFGGKRTSTGRQSRPSRMTPSGRLFWFQGRTKWTAAMTMPFSL